MGYKRVNDLMKKIVVILLMAIVVTPFTFSQETNYVVDQSQLLAYNSTTTYEFFIQASDSFHDLCDYFNNSALDAGLNVYCSFLGGASTICTVYKVFGVACGVNDVIRLTLKGDYDAALYKAAKTSTKLFKFEKSGSEFSLTETRAYCPIQ